MTAAPTQDYASSVQGVAIRVSRLAADGTIPTGPDSSYVMNRFVSATFAPTLEGGTDISLQAADGSMLVSYQTKDVLVRAAMTLAIADPDPEMEEIIAGGTIFTDDTDPTTPISIGWAPAPVGSISNPNGCAVEVWSNMISGGRKTTTLPFSRYLFPRCKMDVTGDHTFENGVMGQEFTGISEPNPGFATGPDTTDPWSWTSDLPYQHVRVDTAPTGVNGYVAVI